MKAETEKRPEPVADREHIAAIANLARQRLVICIAAIAVTSCAVYLNLAQLRNLRVRGFIDIAAVLLWLMVFRLGAGMRALASIAPTEKDKDEQADARLKSWKPPA